MSEDAKENRPERIQMTETDKFTGKVAKVYRDGVSIPVRIESIDLSAKRFVYEILAGRDKGKRMSARFDENQKADVYEKENEVMAFL